MTIQSLIRIESNNNQVIELMQIENNYCVDSRKVAEGIGVQHPNFIETLRTYQEKLERWGKVPFETGPSASGQQQIYAMLNRNQALFAITLSRNTEQVVEWKMALIDALDQLDKHVKGKQIARRQSVRQIETAQTSPDLEERVFNKMMYLAQIGIHAMTPARLAGSYLKTYKSSEIRTVMDSLVISDKLVKTCTAHAPYGRYSVVYRKR